MRYAVLVGLALITGGATYLFRDKGYWAVNNLGANLAAGFLGTLATLFFIERSIERRRQQERSRLAQLALRQLRASLVRIVTLFSNMIKASAAKPFETPPRSLEELFNNTNSETLDWLDLNAQTGFSDQMDWKRYADFVLTSERDLLLSVLDRYLPALDVTLIEAVESITNDDFVRYLRQLPRLSENLAKAGRSGNTVLYGTAEIRNRLFAKLLEAAREVERAGANQVEVPTSLIREDMVPKAGRGRLKALPAHPVLVGPGDPPVGGPPWEGNKNPAGAAPAVAT